MCHIIQSENRIVIKYVRNENIDLSVLFQAVVGLFPWSVVSVVRSSNQWRVVYQRFPFINRFEICFTDNQSICSPSGRISFTSWLTGSENYMLSYLSCQCISLKLMAYLINDNSLRYVLSTIRSRKLHLNSSSAVNDKCLYRQLVNCLYQMKVTHNNISY